jgi:alpha-tubulin suppressor-like RCC1 family protein
MFKNPCAAGAIGNCNLTRTSNGGTSGSCASGSGSCSYSCTNGVWTAVTATCAQPATPTPIAAGLDHSLAVSSNGTVGACGFNSEGQLGNGTNTQEDTPVQVSGLSGVGAVAAGYEHSLAVTSSGTVWAWGYNTYGQLGDGGTATSQDTPVQSLLP